MTSFTSYAFGDNGETTSVNYGPNPTIGKNKQGEMGLYVKYSYSIPNSYSEGFGSSVLVEFVIGRQFIKATDFLTTWNDYVDYLAENNALHDWWSGLRKVRAGTSIAALTAYTKLPDIVTRYTGKEGWWLGKNGKFNRAGWGGNRFTGARSTAKTISTRLTVATKVLGGAKAIISGVQAINDFQHGNTRVDIIHSAYAVMGVVSLFGPVGAAVSGIYFVSRLFWGND